MRCTKILKFFNPCYSLAIQYINVTMLSLQFVSLTDFHDNNKSLDNNPWHVEILTSKGHSGYNSQPTCTWYFAFRLSTEQVAHSLLLLKVITTVVAFRVFQHGIATLSVELQKVMSTCMLSEAIKSDPFNNL
jgi:hypothetical protein